VIRRLADALDVALGDLIGEPSEREGDKILYIFEGTQQIQQLIVARRVLGKTSTELK